MKKLTKRLFAMVIAGTMLLGSSFVVFAGSCPGGGDHNFTNTRRVYVSREATLDHHEHTKIVDGKEYRYGCTTYIYYYQVTQECTKCDAVASWEEKSYVCVPD